MSRSTWSEIKFHECHKTRKTECQIFVGEKEREESEIWKIVIHNREGKHGIKGEKPKEVEETAILLASLGIRVCIRFPKTRNEK